MKTKIHIASCVFLLLLLTISCQNETALQDCSGDTAQYLQTFYSDEFANIPCTLQNIESTEKEVSVRIEDQSDLEKYFSCAEQLPKIDFDKYIIIAGRYRHHQCAILESQQVLLCNNKIFYKVRMLEQACAAFTNVYYFAVIDRAYENLPVEFDVKFSN